MNERKPELSQRWVMCQRCALSRLKAEKAILQYLCYYAETRHFHTINWPSEINCGLFLQMDFKMTAFIFSYITEEAIFRVSLVCVCVCMSGHCSQMPTLNVSVSGFIAADSALWITRYAPFIKVDTHTAPFNRARSVMCLYIWTNEPTLGL